MAARVTSAVYRKNIYQWEQWGRVAAGIAMLVAAVLVEPTIARVVLAASGLMMIVTGLVGWCPACAMFGRDLERGSKHAA